MSISGISPISYPTRVTGVERIGGGASTAKTAALGTVKECQTCKERQYTCGDGTPENVNASTSSSQVMAHEQNHLSEQRADAAKKDMKVVSTNIRVEYSHCPECGRVYASGGEAVSTMVKKSQLNPEGLGNQVDLSA